MRVIGYTFEADVHCPACTARAVAEGRLVPAADPQGTDEHGLPYALRDREGNPVHPVFDTDEGGSWHCGRCGEPLVA